MSDRDDNVDPLEGTSDNDEVAPRTPELEIEEETFAPDDNK